MFAIYKKELNAFLSSMIGYVSIAVFLVFTGLFMWVFTDTSVLEGNYAQMDPLFALGPLIFIFLIPALTMRSYAEEYQKGTIEMLLTKPLSDMDILWGKYLANVTLVLFALLPTVIYYFSVYKLGSPVGNIDSGSVLGAYIGLFTLGCCYVAIGMFSSSLTSNQITAFILGAFLCFILHYSFEFISNLPIFFGKTDDFVERLGMNFHYGSMSKGMIDTRDVIYFLSVIAIFLMMTFAVVKNRR